MSVTNPIAFPLRIATFGEAGMKRTLFPLSGGFANPTSSFTAASCAESMLAMLTAVAPCNQLLKVLYALLKAVAGTVKGVPFAFFRFRALRQFRQAGSLLLSLALPLLLPQYPLLRPFTSGQVQTLIVIFCLTLAGFSQLS